MRKLGPDDRRRVLGCIVVTAAMLLAVACGGGSPTTQFRASRVIAFGDESSMIVDTAGDSNGRKYSVNATVSLTDPTIACAVNPLWIQSVATLYGLSSRSATRGRPDPAPVSRIRAEFGARAADLAAQIDAQQAESPLHSGDLVTVMVGANDVLAQYAQYPTIGEAELIANLEAAGAETGRQLNRLADTGAKVLVATIFDMGFTPFAAAENAANTDIDRAALLSRLSARYNAGMRATMVNDGRRIGLILLDEFIGSVGKNPRPGGFTNVNTGVCDLTKSILTPPSTLDCTAQTFIPLGTATYLWADNLHLSATGQSSFGSLALSRAENNPF
jgi:Phospholipase/lecithinase/hemolysin